jgi:hypothetical protein
VPGRARAKVAGELETSQHSAPRLELGHLLGRPPDSVPIAIGRLLSGELSDTTYPVILGTTIEGEPITLVSAQQLSRPTVVSRLLSRPIQREILSADWAYAGAHLPHESDRTFRDATLELTDLLIWAGATGLGEHHEGNLRDVTVSLTLPDPCVVELPIGRLTLAHGWCTTGDLRRSRGIQKSVGFRVETSEPFDVPTLLARFGNPLRYLLTFATDRPNEIERLTVKTMRYDRVRGTDVLVEYPRIGDPRTLSDSIGIDYLFDARTLGDRFAAVVTAWFELYDRIRPALNLLFGPRYRPGTFTDNHFLNVVAAAEGYHRAAVRNEVLPPAEHKVRLASVVTAAPDEHRSWLEERLAHSNEPTLRERLVELHGRAGGIVSGVLGSAHAFAGPVVTARNALTHRGKPNKAKEIAGRELFRLTEQTAFLLTTCLMLDLGFGELEVVEATRRSRRFRILTEVFGQDP